MTLTAGNGLTGGGTLETSRTFTLGTPSSITNSSTNSVGTTTHTHAIDKASTTVVGIVKLNDSLTSSSTTLALTANQGKVIAGRLTALEDM
ncbi:MAG: tail fiber protein [Methanobrevibacter sp.]|nr:tail fiber protein [Methanobrevibacter sp.]